MNFNRAFNKLFVVVFVVSTMTLIFPSLLSSHCDTMNGPVIIAAKKALEIGNVNLVLIWVQKDDENAIKEAFQKTMAVRKLNSQARKLADMYFFETLVRIHRAGEGVAYTGLKQAETEIEPSIAAADKAIESGSAEELLHHLGETIHQNVAAQYKQVAAKKNFKPDDVEAGREYVEAYVQFIHYVERLHQAATLPAEGHFYEPEEIGAQHEKH